MPRSARVRRRGSRGSLRTAGSKPAKTARSIPSIARTNAIRPLRPERRASFRVPATCVFQRSATALSRRRRARASSPSRRRTAARILGKARSDGYAVGYFEAWDACSLEAVLTAAEEESAPVILGFGAMMVDGQWLDRGGIEVLGAVGRSYAARSSVDVALLFNEAHTLDQARRGIDAGFNAVMIDTHSWPTDDAIVAVRELCRVADRK